MSIDIDDFADRPDGACQSCGAETEEEHHRLCMHCYRDAMGWTRPARPGSGEPPRSFVVGLNELREQVARLEMRLELIESLLKTRPTP